LREGVSPRYLPAEDTELLIRVLSRYTAHRFLEIGFGSGAVLRSVGSRFPIAAGTDILTLPEARLSGPFSNLILADRATCFRDGVFDLVAFNPPYLPSEEVLDAAVDGGTGGIERPLAFLREALRVARADGVVLALLSDRADITAFESACASMGLSCRQVASEELFYEKISVFEISRVGPHFA
jgi:release factor glutamine methyltransferase